MTLPADSQPFKRIRSRYRLVNRVLSLGMDRNWRRRAVASLKPTGGVVLDVGCGPGDMLEFFTAAGCVRIGLDPVVGMMREAAAGFDGVQAVAEAMPIKSGVVDTLVSAFAVRNFLDRRCAFTEMARVMRPEGQGVILEFSPLLAGAMRIPLYVYIRLVIPLVGGTVSGDFAAYRYLSRTLLNFPQPEAIARELKAAGFVEVSHRRLKGWVTVMYRFRKPGKSLV